MRPISAGLSGFEGQVDQCRQGRCPGLHDLSRWRCCSATCPIGCGSPPGWEVAHIRPRTIQCLFFSAKQHLQTLRVDKRCHRCPFHPTWFKTIRIIFPITWGKSSISGRKTFMKSFSHGLKLAIPYGEIPFLAKPTSIFKSNGWSSCSPLKNGDLIGSESPVFTQHPNTIYTYTHIIYIYTLYSVNLSSFYPSIFPGCSHNNLFKLLPFFSVPPVQPILYDAHHQLRPCGRRQELRGNFEGAGGGVLWLRAQRRWVGSPRLIHLG